MADARPLEERRQSLQASSGQPFSDILCAVDGTRRSFDAVEQAALLAGADGCLTLIAVTAVTGAGAYREAAISPMRAERVLERASEIAQAAGVACRATIEPRGPVDRTILERASAHELLAIGAPAGAFGGIFSDGVAASALASLATPLLICRPTPHSEQRFAQHVVVASDGLDGSDELVQLAARIARAQRSEVVLVHAIGVESRTRPHRIERQTQTLARLLPAGAWETFIEPGAPAQTVLDAAARRAASLIISGTRGLHGLHAIGSVSRRVARDASCSVLLVPPSGLSR